MMHKTKFGNIRVGEPFLLNGIFYFKINETEGLSLSLRVFVLKFSDLKIGESFIFNEVFYFKINEIEGLSLRLRVFVFNDFDLVHYFFEL